MDVELINAIGHVVFTRSGTFDCGKNTVTISAAGIASGMYMLRIKNDSGVKHTGKVFLE